MFISRYNFAGSLATSVFYFLNDLLLSKWMARFGRLKRGNTPGTGERAPHKPVMLLAVLDELDAGSIPENRIFITPELVASFKDNWSRYVTSLHFRPDFTKPFFHLKGEGWWRLHMLPGREALLTASGSPKSFISLKESVKYASLDDELYALLHQASTRKMLRAALLAAYFGGAHVLGTGYIHEVENQLLHEAPVVYRQQAPDFDEEDQVARKGVFKRLIPRIYNYTCCISGMRIVAAAGVQMVDACHIVPWADTQDDTISNGLSLCPNLHRAFDRGLIRIDDDYRVVVSAAVMEAESGYGIKGFGGKRIALPEEREYWPGLENLEKHWMQWGVLRISHRL